MEEPEIVNFSLLKESQRNCIICDSFWGIGDRFIKVYEEYEKES
jgi:hypothetical protein